MSGRLYKSQTVTGLFFVLLLVLNPFVFITFSEGMGYASQKQQPNPIEMASNLLSSFGGGEAISAISKEVTNMIQLVQTGTKLAKALNNEETLEALNFFIEVAIISLPKATESLNKLPYGDAMTSEDVEDLIKNYKKHVKSALEEKKDFPKTFITMLGTYSRSFTPALVEGYKGIESMGMFTVTNGMVLQATSLVRLVDPKLFHINKNTFDTILRVPDQMSQQFESLLGNMFKGEHMNMLSTFFQAMSANSQPQKRKTDTKHDDL